MLVPLVLICVALLGATQYAFLEKSFFRELGMGLTGPAGRARQLCRRYSARRFYRDAIETTLIVAAAATLGCILLRLSARVRDRADAVALGDRDADRRCCSHRS